MARPKAFHVGDALDQAIHQFGKHGFTATSLDDLTAAMGISRSSLYDTFGSKHDLFLAAISHHNETLLPLHLAPLDRGKNGPKQAIAQIFIDTVDGILKAPDHAGMFLTKIACEVAPGDARATTSIAHGLQTIEASFLSSITDGQQTGEIAPWRDPRTLARHFTAALSGLAVIGQTRPNRGALEDIASVALTALD